MLSVYYAFVLNLTSKKENIFINYYIHIHSFIYIIAPHNTHHVLNFLFVYNARDYHHQTQA
jgi:hypothetical protein